MTLLVVSLLALVVGPLLYRVAHRARATMAGLDGFVMVAVAGLALVHIIPHAATRAGPLALLVALFGFVVPGVIEHQLERAASRAHAATMALAIGGLVLHEFFDGVGLATPGEHGDSVLAIAVVLHRLPIAITIWWLLVPSSGRRTAIAVLVALGVSTILGYVAGDVAASALESSWIGLLEALIAGSLLHVVVHRPAPLAMPSGGRLERLAGGVGALVGVAVVAALVEEHLDLAAHGEIGFSAAFVALSLESAPALLLAFALAGLIQVAMPAASLAWMGRGRPLTQAVRGVAFGLPLPICSCGVIPLYRTLVTQGVPASAAMAFLVATPELGIDAILISLPLLGPDLMIARIVAAAVVALAVGVLVGRWATLRVPLSAPPAPVAVRIGALGRMRAGLRFGLVEIVDHTAPWLLVGLAIAALAAPLLDAAWLTALPPGVDVVLFALLGLPLYVCASGATPLVAVLIAKGVSPGAALAFLLTGPATNVTTFGVLADLHGRKLALAFGGVIAALTIGLGLALNTLVDLEVPRSLAEVAADQHGGFEIAALAALTVVVALSVLRQGPRGFVGQVLSPYAPEGGHGHDHGHGHDDGHGHG